VAAHIGYLNAFAGLPLFQMSYWSLAIEFQYYLFVGLVFPMLARPGYAESATIYAAIALTSLLAGHNKAFLPQFLPLFLIGITVFRFKCLGIHWLDLTLGIGIGVILVFFLQGPPPAIAGLASALTILFVNGTTRLLTFFGKISYSLYLMHVIVGDIVYGLAVRHASHPGLLRWVLPFIALGVAIAIAFILYRVVEVPSKRWSSAIRYDTQILPSLVEVAS
jgi:peptidoglycan/LPS O-acetylase OafA/YrhL